MMSPEEFKEAIINLAKTCEETSEINWGVLPVYRDTVYNLYASKVIEMYDNVLSKESEATQIVNLLSYVLYLSVELFVSDLKSADDLK